MGSRSGAHRRRSVLASAFVLTAAGLGGLATRGAPATTRAPAPPASTITAGPAAGAVTNAATVTFTYANAQGGVTFRCAIDRGAFADCAANGVSYTGLAEGTHTFKVGAVAGDSALGAQASRSFVIDRTVPTVTATFPAAGASVSAAAWAAGCSHNPGVCGTAADGRGVAEVVVALLQASTARYWDGAAFSSTGPVFLPASGTTAWRLPLASRPDDGAYSALVRATDVAGNTTTEAGTITRSFTVDTAPAGSPVLADVPDALTARTTARITFAAADTDDASTTTFQCRYDMTLFKTCASPFSIIKLRVGEHCFSVKALDVAGNASGVATACWTVIIDNGFTIAGEVADALTPGAAARIDVSIANPFAFDVKVLEVTTKIGAGTTIGGLDNPGCNSSANFEVTEQLEALSAAIVVPAHTTSLLSELGVHESRWPQVTMRMLLTDQTACQGARFRLAYTGAVTTP